MAGDGAASRQSGEPGESPTIFVVGVPRSGTTMLSAMMNTHSRIAMSPELHYFTQHWSVCERALAPGGEGPDALVDYLLKTAGVRDMQLTPAEVETVRARVRASSPADHRAIHTAFVQTYADRTGKELYGEKTPAYLLHIPILEATFPGCRYLCIVRDPRDISLSRRKSKMRGGPLYHALVWRRFYKEQTRYRKELGDRFHVVRYEDLVADPRTELTRCCQTVGVDFEEAMLGFHAVAGQNFNPVREPWKVKATTPVDPSNVDKWKTALPAAHVAITELVLRRLMDDAGYVRRKHRWTPTLVRSMAATAVKDVRGTITATRRRKARQGRPRGADG